MKIMPASDIVKNQLDGFNEYAKTTIGINIISHYENKFPYIFRAIREFETKENLYRYKKL